MDRTKKINPQKDVIAINEGILFAHDTKKRVLLTRQSPDQDWMTVSPKGRTTSKKRKTLAPTSAKKGKDIALSKEIKEASRAPVPAFAPVQEKKDTCAIVSQPTQAQAQSPPSTYKETASMRETTQILPALPTLSDYDSFSSTSSETFIPKVKTVKNRKGITMCLSQGPYHSPDSNKDPNVKSKKSVENAESNPAPIGSSSPGDEIKQINKRAKAVARESLLIKPTATPVVSRDEKSVHNFPKKKKAVQLIRNRVNHRACPRCFHIVHRLTDHLRRSCMTNAMGFTQENRNQLVAADNLRIERLKVSVVYESTLMENAVILEDGRAYLEIGQVIKLLESVGILVIKGISGCIYPTAQMGSQRQPRSDAPKITEPSPVQTRSRIPPSRGPCPSIMQSFLVPEVAKDTSLALPLGTSSENRSKRKPEF